MPTTIQYPAALAQLQAAGFVCHYINSGAMGFARDAAVHIEGWISKDDPTIVAEMRSRTAVVPLEQMAQKCVERWEQQIAGPLWLMPMSHWAYELNYSGEKWLAEALAEAGVDYKPLIELNNASPVVFEKEESGVFLRWLEKLIAHFRQSDWMLVFPQGAALCMAHHHRQLWWTRREG